MYYVSFPKMKPPEFGQAEWVVLIWKKWVEILHYQVRNSTTGRKERLGTSLQTTPQSAIVIIILRRLYFTVSPIVVGKQSDILYIFLILRHLIS